jgi:hypothetical protein
MPPPELDAIRSALGPLIKSEVYMEESARFVRLAKAYWVKGEDASQTQFYRNSMLALFELCRTIGRNYFELAQKYQADSEAALPDSKQPTGPGGTA